MTAPLPLGAQATPAARSRARSGSTRSSTRRLPLDLRFRDEAGRDVRLGDYFGRRPVILALVYYGCPLLCNQVLNGLTRSLKPLSLDAGKDFEVVAVSIDPGETPELAGREEGRLPGALRPARGRAGLAFPDRRRGSRSTRLPRRSGSATPTTRRPSTTPTPRAS